MSVILHKRRVRGNAWVAHTSAIFGFDVAPKQAFLTTSLLERRYVHQRKVRQRRKPSPPTRDGTLGEAAALQRFDLLLQSGGHAVARQIDLPDIYPQFRRHF